MLVIVCCSGKWMRATPAASVVTICFGAVHPRRAAAKWGVAQGEVRHDRKLDRLARNWFPLDRRQQRVEGARVLSRFDIAVERAASGGCAIAS